MSYLVKEVFYTIQGEGFHAGTPAVFCRFAGCNVWSGLPETRARDTEKGGCAAWCDTDFVGGEKLELGDLVQRIVSCAGTSWHHGMLVVFTGGEPSLQLDADLVRSIKALGGFVAVETNGSRRLPSIVDWVCLSPKPPMKVVINSPDEVKVIVPAFDPMEFDGFSRIRWVQPQDSGDATINERNIREAVRFVQSHVGWRLSCQTHKMMGLR